MPAGCAFPNGRAGCLTASILSNGIALVLGKGDKERYVPLGEHAVHALETRYLQQGRPQLLARRHGGCGRLVFEPSAADRFTDRSVRRIVEQVRSHDVARTKKIESAHAPPYVCDPYAGGGSGSAHSAGIARACQHFDDADLHAYDAGSFADDIQPGPSARHRR